MPHSLMVRIFDFDSSDLSSILSGADYKNEEDNYGRNLETTSV